MKESKKILRTFVVEKFLSCLELFLKYLFLNFNKEFLKTWFRKISSAFHVNGRKLQNVLRQKKCTHEVKDKKLFFF